jgi:hypothetical protein
LARNACRIGSRAIGRRGDQRLDVELLAPRRQAVHRPSGGIDGEAGRERRIAGLSHRGEQPLERAAPVRRPAAR